MRRQLQHMPTSLLDSYAKEWDDFGVSRTLCFKAISHSPQCLWGSMRINMNQHESMCIYLSIYLSISLSLSQCMLRIFWYLSHPKTSNFAGFAQCSDPSLPVAVRVATSALDAGDSSRGRQRHQLIQLLIQFQTLQQYYLILQLGDWFDVKHFWSTLFEIWNWHAVAVAFLTRTLGPMAPMCPKHFVSIVV